MIWDQNLDSLIGEEIIMKHDRKHYGLSALEEYDTQEKFQLKAQSRLGKGGDAYETKDAQERLRKGNLKGED